MVGPKGDGHRTMAPPKYATVGFAFFTFFSVLQLNENCPLSSSASRRVR